MLERFTSAELQKEDLKPCPIVFPNFDVSRETLNAAFPVPCRQCTWVSNRFN